MIADQQSQADFDDAVEDESRVLLPEFVKIGVFCMVEPVYPG